jgi:hypothetical protein
METKTIFNWLTELKQPYRMKAIDNTGIDNLIYERNSLHQAVLGAFDWHKSPEGAEYWLNLYNAILDEEL